MKKLNDIKLLYDTGCSINVMNLDRFELDQAQHDNKKIKMVMVMGKKKNNIYKKHESHVQYILYILHVTKCVLYTHNMDVQCFKKIKKLCKYEMIK